jgi:two-component system, OmpR family, phosphate regulon sensor histidine kinase PhoR
MPRITVRWLVVLSTLSIIGVLITQIYWVSKAFALKERQFNQRVHVALQDVAEQLADFNKVMLNNNPVEELSSDYFLVNTNSHIQPEILEHYIKTIFKKHDLITDFEVGVYDCTTDRMMYGVALSTISESQKPTTTANWIKTNKYPYYFGIRFPQQSLNVAGSLGGWIWSSALVLLAVGFFGYALFVILKQKQLTEIQRDFINNMTHELQTPIATIKIAADVLNTHNITAQPDRLKRYVRIVQEETQRLQYQIESVLNMAKAEKNKLYLEPEWLDAHQVIDNLAQKYEDKITLHLNAEGPYIDADRFLMTNALNNLIDNALKYSGDKPVVSVETYNHNGTFIVSVIDKGIGIASEHQSKIFKKFYRVPTGNIHNVKGFGIGLSYVHQIIKAHGWKIELKSQPGQGSEFKILIPIK